MEADGAPTRELLIVNRKGLHARGPDVAGVARDLLIVNRKGLHARATAKFVQCVELYDADVTVTRCGETVGGQSIMGILTLGAGKGTTITVAATGRDAETVVDAHAAQVGDPVGDDQ